MIHTMGYQHEQRATRPAPLPARGPGQDRRSKSKQPTPFDPEELSRRLYIVVAEREAQAERRRRVRGDASGHSASPDLREARLSKVPPTQEPNEKPSSGRSRPRQPQEHKRPGSRIFVGSHPSNGEGKEASGYRHVPQVAATQFARTTTVDSAENRSLVHKLSKKAMKFHMSGPNGDHDMSERDDNAAPCERTRTLRKAQCEREKQYDRNQFQHPAILEADGEPDERQIRLVSRHTFETHFKERQDSWDTLATRRMSTASALQLQRSSEVPGTAEHMERQDSLEKDLAPRVDWSQSDEGRTPRDSPDQPRLRKPQSKWTLKGRFGGFQKAKNVPPSPPPDDELTPELKSPKALKSAKSGFFSRFKR